MESVYRRFIGFKINVLEFSLLLTFFLSLIFLFFHIFIYRGDYQLLVILSEFFLVITSFWGFKFITESNYKIIAIIEFCTLLSTVFFLSIIYPKNYYLPIWMFGTIIVFTLATDYILGIIFLIVSMAIFNYLFFNRVDWYAFLTLNFQFIAYFLFGLILIKKIELLQQKTYYYEKLLYETSIKDSLTQIYNRKYFEKTVQLLLEKAKRNNQKVLFLIIDIDYFKKINDKYGHPVGDLVLKKITNILQQNLRKSDLLARIGGEEFAVYIDDCKEDNCINIAEKLRESINNFTIQIDDNITISSTISIGGIFSKNYDYEYLYKKADAALYEAKKNRNRTIIYIE